MHLPSWTIWTAHGEISVLILSSVYQQGMITLVLDCVDRLNVYNTAAHFSEFAGEEAAESWKEIVNLLYELLGRFPLTQMLDR